MAAWVREHKGVAKAASYSVMHCAVAVSVAFLLSGSWAVALGIGLVEPLVQTVAYTLHEKGWSRL